MKFDNDIEVHISDAGEVTVAYKGVGLSMVVIGDLAEGGDQYFADDPIEGMSYSDDPLYAAVKPGQFLVGSWTIGGEFVRLHRHEVEAVRG